jgi:phosphoglycerol transferase MdoB-like AlkP superfamily enzyme
MVSIKHLILNLLKQLLVVFVFYTISRILFFYFNRNTFQDLAFLDLFKLLFFGLRFDAFSICVTNALFILLAILPFKFQEQKIYKKTLFYIFIFLNSFSLLLNFIDFVYFPYIQKRSTYDVIHLIFGSQTEFFKLLPFFLLENWFLIIIYCVLIFVLIKVYQKIEQSIKIKTVEKNLKFSLINTLGFLAIASFTVLGIRGGLQRVPIVFLDAALYTSQRYIPIVINTPFSLIKSAELNQIESLHFFEEKELKKYSTQIIKGDTATFKNLNVCVIILESFSKEFTKYGNRKSYTPFLDSLISVSTYYNNAFANGKSSINGIPAIISSMPTYMDDPYLNSTYSNNTLNGLPLLLKQKGYYTSFFHGATNGSMNFNSYAKSAGYDIYFGRTEYDNDLDYDGQWGIWDEPFLIRMAKEIKTFKAPFFTTVFTLSSHHPYKVPEKYKNKFPKGSLEIHESIGYSDYSLRSFFDHIKNSHWFQNTLFVISADHTAVSEDSFYGNSIGQYSIPIIFYRPGQKGEIINKNIQQIDIMPTILDLLNYDKTYFSFGKSVIADNNLPIVYYNSPNYNLINDSIVYLFNHFKITEAYNFKADSNLSHPLQRKNLKKEFDATNYIKALLQNYNNNVLNNKTFYNNQ